MTQESRSYGHGAAGDLISTAQATKPSLRMKMRYRFDNSLSRGAGAFASWLAIISLILSIVITIVWHVTDTANAGGFSLSSRFFESLNIIFLGASTPFGTPAERVVAIGFWIIKTAVAGSVIGFITNIIADRMERLKKGKSPVIETGHTLILGWSSRVFPILQQLALANENVANPLVVIFADEDRELMDDEITARVGDLGKTRVVTRRGDTTNPRDLERANIQGAKSIIILDADDTGDAAIVSTVLAVRACNVDSKLSIVAEIDEIDHAAALHHATEGQVQSVQSHDVIARVTAQASRQPGLAAVILDLLDFEGDEIYFAHVNQLEGKTYGEALTAFDKSAVIGIAHANGTVSINPAMDTRIAATDKIIAISEDDDKVIFTGLRDELSSHQAVAHAGSVKGEPEHLLVIGWSTMGHAVLTELAQFLAEGSSIHIVANPELVDTTGLSSLKFGGIPVTFAQAGNDVAQLTKFASARKYNEIIVLGYRDTISVQESDAHTMMTMLLLNKLFAEEGNGVDPTRLVAEILDSRRAELARVAAVDDLVVSDNLAALMIAQISENPALSPVFTDLFDADGASVNVKPASYYATVGAQVSFAELVAAARSRGESAVGYRIAAISKTDQASGVRLNPHKEDVFTIAAHDGVVVIGDSRN